MLRQLTYITVIAIFSTIPFLANGQSYVTAKSLKGKDKKIYEKAISAFQKGDNEVALKYFGESVQRVPGLIDAYLRMGAIHYTWREYDDAEKLFIKALDLSPDYDVRIYFSLANIQREKGDYESSISNYREFIRRSPRETDAVKRAKKYLKQAEFSAEAVKNPVPFKPFRLNSEINKETSEYLPSITADGTQMIFTVREAGYEDFYISFNENGDWGPRQPIEELNTPGNEGGQSVSGDGKTLVFAKATRNYSFDLYISEKKSGKWSRPRNLDLPVNTRAWEAQPSLSADGNVMYFSSNRPGGLGGKDIWKTHRKANGEWSKPINLGPGINSKGDEESPFIHSDDHTLYFRSNGHPGMGDFDIFYARKQEGAWGKAKNIGYPINSPQSEGALFVSFDGKKAFFASDQGQKNLDLFEFELYEEARPLSLSFVKAEIFHFETGEQINDASLKIESLNTGNRYLEKQLEKTNEFLVTLPANDVYAIHVEKKGFVFYSENFTIDSLANKIEPKILRIELKPVRIREEAKPIVLNNIFFETGSSQLLESSTFELNGLYNLLKDNPDIKIKIIGHTDNVGEEDDNLQLSTDRAKSVYNYLVSKGIKAQRLQFEGKGESSPIDSNDTEEGRQNNRRTEFLIIPD